MAGKESTGGEGGRRLGKSHWTSGLSSRSSVGVSLRQEKNALVEEADADSESLAGRADSAWKSNARGGGGEPGG